MALRDILDKVEGMLTGETARAIGYGAGAVVYAVAKVSGAIPDVPLDQALVGTAAYVTVLASVVETIRHFVYSPQTASDLLDMIGELQDELEDLRAQQAAEPAGEPVEGVQDPNGGAQDEPADGGNG